MPQGSCLGLVLFFTIHQQSLWLSGIFPLSICWLLHPLMWHPSSFRWAGSSLFPLFRPWQKSQAGQTLGICLLTFKNVSLSVCLSVCLSVSVSGPYTVLLPTFLKKFSHSNPWVSLSATISLGQTTCQVALQSQLLTGHLLSCKILPWLTWTLVHLQGFHPRLD